MAEGEFALVSKRLESALALSGQPVKRGTMAHEHIVYMMLVDSAATAGDLPGLERFVPELKALAERDQHAPYRAVALRAEGVAHRLRGDVASAEAALLAALDIFETTGMDWQAGRTLTELGLLETSRSEQEAADVYYNRALDVFERIHARPAFDRARDAMNRTDS